jgi:hypothetical protein
MEWTPKRLFNIWDEKIPLERTCKFPDISYFPDFRQTRGVKSGKKSAGGSHILAATEKEGNSSVWSPEERLHTASDPSGTVECNGMSSSSSRGLCNGLIPRPRKKHLLRKKNNKKWDRSTRWRPTVIGEKTYDWPLGMYDLCTDQEAFVLRLMSSGNTRSQ